MLNGCDPTDSITDQINFLTQADSVDLFRLDLQNQLSTGFGWSAISRDDYFYTSDAQVKYHSGNLNPIDLVIGYNSHEGSLVRPVIESAFPNGTAEEINGFLSYGFGLFAFVLEWNTLMGTDLTLTDHYNNLVTEFKSYAAVDDLSQKQIHFLSKFLVFVLLLKFHLQLRN